MFWFAIAVCVMIVVSVLSEGIILGWCCWAFTRPQNGDFSFGQRFSQVVWGSAVACVIGFLVHEFNQ